MKSAEIHLPYWKQGDDLNHFLRTTDNVGAALDAHADMLELSAGILRDIKSTIQGHQVEFDADTHHISIAGPDEVIQELIAGGNAQELEDEDEIENNAK